MLHYSTPRGSVQAVDSVSFSVEGSGQANGIIGETGSGKSSLVAALTRILPQNIAKYEGEIFFEGSDLFLLPDDRFRREVRWKKIAVVFQGAMNGFNPVVRIGRQIAERMLLEKGKKQPAVYEEIKSLIESVGLSPEIIERYPHELSGGMKQRAAIAMAMSMKPPIIILDEPTSALDVSVQAQVMNVLKHLKWETGLSMVFITHDIALASDISDYITVMYGGQIREYGPADEVLRHPKDPYTQDLLDSIPRLHGSKKPDFVSGVQPDLITPPAGCRFHPRCRHVFEPCAAKPPRFFKVDKGHYARCWLYENKTDAENE